MVAIDLNTGLQLVFPGAKIFPLSHDESFSESQSANDVHVPGTIDATFAHSHQQPIRASFARENATKTCKKRRR
jgi:hypothetical protein